MTTARDVIAGMVEYILWKEMGRGELHPDAAAGSIADALVSEPVRMELAALLSPGRSINPWRPIETAPKDEDETSILIGNNRHNDCRIAYYEHDADPTYPWHVEDAAKGFNHHRDWPTHWMPRPSLPAPPSEDKT